MVKIEIEIFGEKQVVRGFNVMMENNMDFRPVWKKFRRHWNRHNRLQFETEGVHGSKGWKPLTKPYKAWKDKHYPGKTILRRKNRLFRSLTVPSHKDYVFGMRPKSVTLGTLVPYAIYHQKGSEDGTLPSRPVVEMVEEEKTALVRLVHQHLLENTGFQRYQPYPEGGA